MAEFETWEEHQNYILARFGANFKFKYEVGQKEHGGRLWKKAPFNMLKDEAVDFISYVYTLENHLNDVTSLLTNAIVAEDWALVGDALNVLQVGNEEGRMEEDL